MAEEAAPTQPRQKTGLKLKIKFGGTKRSVQVVETQHDRSGDLGTIGLPEASWLQPARVEWKALRQAAELPLREPQAPTTQPAQNPTPDPPQAAAKPQAAVQPSAAKAGAAVAMEVDPPQAAEAGADAAEQGNAAPQSPGKAPAATAPGPGSRGGEEGREGQNVDIAKAGELESEKEAGEASPSRPAADSTSSSSSSSSSDSSDSESDRGAPRRRKRQRSASSSLSRPRSRSREPGEHSDSDEAPARKRSWRSRDRSRSLSPGRGRRESWRRDDERWRARSYHDSRRFSRERDTRSHDRRRSPGRQRSRRRSPDPRRFSEPRRCAPTRTRRTDSVSPSPAQVPRSRPATPPPPREITFAEAWALVNGSCQEELGTEGDIDALGTAATKAKHAADNVAKGNGGKHSLENLVTLMRESYLKYTKACVIWEGLLRTPEAVPSHRTRAKLADEGGMYPCTIALIRQLGHDARGCGADAEATRLLRLLAERLVAVLHMRLLQVQRGKLQQDRQILLACKGAPATNAAGRIIPPPADGPGETFQRPSPTDSNASNSTGELALNPAAAKTPGRTPPPQPKAAASRPPTQPAAAPKSAPASAAAQAKGKASRQGRPPPIGKTPLPPQKEEPGKAKAGRSSGRDDAWSVEPLPWQIPAQKAETVTRSWSLLGGVASYTGQFRLHAEELAGLGRSEKVDVREAAAMLGFLDVALGMSSAATALRLADGVLALILRLAQPPLPP